MNYERAWKDLKSWVCLLEQETKDAPAEGNDYALIVGQNWAFGAMYDKMDELDGTRKRQIQLRAYMTGLEDYDKEKAD